MLTKFTRVVLNRGVVKQVEREELPAVYQAVTRTHEGWTCPC